MGIQAVCTAPRSPWQNAYTKRVIGSIRRECTDHVVVVTEGGLRRILAGPDRYHHARTHLALDKDTPLCRPVATGGTIVAIPEVGGLHHRYQRRAA